MIEPRIVGIMLAKDEADVIPDVIANLSGALDALYYHAGDVATAAAIHNAAVSGWARKVTIPEGAPHTDGLRHYLLEQARRDAASDNDSRPMWIMVVQGDEIYHDDLRAHVLYAHQIGATMMTCQVATFLLHESQRDGWDWSLPLEKRLTHYVWDFGEHTGFLDKPTVYYDPSVHMRAHPFGTDDGVWSPARPVRKHYPFRTPAQARKRLADRLRPTEQHPQGWQPHYKNYEQVFVGDMAANRPVRRYRGTFPEVYRHPNFQRLPLEQQQEDFWMYFEIKPPFVIFHDDKPGSHAMMRSVRGVTVVCYPFRNDASHFDDSKSRYAWAFEGSPQPGDKLTFATSEREVDGVVSDNGTSVAFSPMIDGRVRVYVGAGCDAASWSRRGWRCNDIAAAAAIWPGIDLVGPCWDLPLPDNSVDEIMAKGMIEHLTYHEVARAFKEWRRVLKPGGFFTGEVPDVDEYIRQFLAMRAAPETIEGEGDSQATRSDGEPDDFEACAGIERWLRRALFGWQRWPGDEHRSGWTEALFKFYIEKHFGGRHEIRRMGISFDEDVPGTQRVRHLWARAWKE